MKQAELKTLLQEAASPDCAPMRRLEIEHCLCEATAALDRRANTYKIDGPEHGLHMLLEFLYADTIRHRPDLLLALFPVFAMLCGDRDEHHITANVDWSLVDQNASEGKVKVEIRCERCAGSGVRRSLWRESHIVCPDCRGSGRQVLEYAPFDGRQVVPGVTLVSSSDYGPLEVTVSYQEFLAGKIPRDKI